MSPNIRTNMEHHSTAPLSTHLLVSLLSHFNSFPPDIQKKRSKIVEALKSRGFPIDIVERTFHCPVDNVVKYNHQIDIDNGALLFESCSTRKNKLSSNAAFILIKYCCNLHILIEHFQKVYNTDTLPLQIINCLQRKCIPGFISILETEKGSEIDIYKTAIFNANGPVETSMGEAAKMMIKFLAQFSEIKCSQANRDKTVVRENTKWSHNNNCDITDKPYPLDQQSLFVAKSDDTPEECSFVGAIDVFKSEQTELNMIHEEALHVTSTVELLQDSMDYFNLNNAKVFLISRLNQVNLNRTALQVLGDLKNKGVKLLIEQSSFVLNGKTVHSISIQIEPPYFPTFQAEGSSKLESKKFAAEKIIAYLLELDQAELNAALIPCCDTLLLDAPTCQIIYDAVQKHWTQLSSQSAHSCVALAAYVITSDIDQSDVRVLSIGTGSKCVFSKAITLDGKIVCDSHAEIVARRALVCLLYDHLQELTQNGLIDTDELIIEPVRLGKGFRLKPHLKLHLFITKPPCGAALQFRDDKLRVKLEAFIGMYQEMPMEYVSNYAKIQEGEQKSTFMTCSDKVAMWNVVGVQGALLSAYIEPIYLHSLVVSENFHYDSFTRIFYDRIDVQMLDNYLGNDSPGFRLNRHKVGHYRPVDHEKLFDLSQTKKSPQSLNWYRALDSAEPIEIEVINSQSGTLFHDEGKPSRLSKYLLVKRYQKLLSETSPLLGEWKILDDQSLECNCKSERSKERRSKIRGTYYHLKEQSSAYQNAKSALIMTFAESGQGNWVNAYGGQTDMFLI